MAFYRFIIFIYFFSFDSTHGLLLVQIDPSPVKRDDRGSLDGFPSVPVAGGHFEVAGGGDVRVEAVTRVANIPIEDFLRNLMFAEQLGPMQSGGNVKYRILANTMNIIKPFYVGTKKTKPQQIPRKEEKQASTTSAKISNNTSDEITPHNRRKRSPEIIMSKRGNPVTQIANKNGILDNQTGAKDRGGTFSWKQKIHNEAAKKSSKMENPVLWLKQARGLWMKKSRESRDVEQFEADVSRDKRSMANQRDDDLQSTQFNEMQLAKRVTGFDSRLILNKMMRNLCKTLCAPQRKPSNGKKLSSLCSIRQCYDILPPGIQKNFLKLLLLHHYVNKVKDESTTFPSA